MPDRDDSRTVLGIMADEESRPPDEPSVGNDLDSLARWLEARDCNRDGTDKAYVFRALEEMRRWAEFARNAQRVELHE